ncbi:MAG: tetratricopeptide repeat protein [Verrucomicrobiales bacterium]|nr:tetratricopeptide repeat protein [Verrucomicrobiales bacterium]
MKKKPSTPRSRVSDPVSGGESEVGQGRPMLAGLALGGGLLALVAGIVWVLWPRPDHQVVDASVAARVERDREAPPPFVMPDEAATFATYAGSATCQECHAEEFAKWQTSHHALAERQPTSAMEDAAFVPSQTFTHGSQSTEARRAANGDFELVTLGLGGERRPYPVQRVIGETPLRQFLVDGGQGRLQAMDACWDPSAKQWFNVYGDEDRQPGEWGHWTGRGMVWNQMCASCHNTRVRKNYDPTTDGYHTAMAEMTVSCESCHGPLKEHVEWQRRYPEAEKGEDPTLPQWDRDQQVENCAGCHARRGEITGDFKPGDSFWDHYLLTVTDATDTYYPDGQVRDENYVFSSYMSSRMQHRGVRCMDCHDMHSMKTLLPGNQLCMRCHTAGGYEGAPPIVPDAHTFHTAESTGSQCVNCHMPQTVYMQRDGRHDHGWTIPDPLLTRDFGVPNACNRCHTDQSADWSLQAVEKWYGPRMERPTRHRAQLIARARRGDAGVVPGLLDLLTTEEVPTWRATVASLLDRWSAQEPVRRALLGQLDHPHPLVRVAVIRALEPLVLQGNTAVQRAVEPALNDPARSVRVTAAWALRESVDLASSAAQDLQHMLSLNSDQPSGQMQLGQFHFARGDVSQAAASIQKAIDWDPFSPPFHHDLAMLYSHSGDVTRAIQKLEDAIRLAPQEAQYRYELGLAYSESGDLEKTAAALREAVRLDPQFGRAWYNLGLALNGLERPEEAVDALLKGEIADPQDPGIPYARATILARLGKKAEALQAVDRTLQIEPAFQPAQQLRLMLAR